MYLSAVYVEKPSRPHPPVSSLSPLSEKIQPTQLALFSINLTNKVSFAACSSLRKATLAVFLLLYSTEP